MRYLGGNPVLKLPESAWEVGDTEEGVATVDLQILDPNGAPVNQQMMVRLFVCSDADCVSLVDTMPDGGVQTEVTKGAICGISVGVPVGIVYLITNGQGAARLQITESGTGTFYLGALLPDGSYIKSEAVVFS